MKINGQHFTLTTTHIILELKEPYWGAWTRFNWPERTEGYSINKDAIDKAVELNKKIMFKTRWGDYEITTKKALRDGSPLEARDGTELICIPRFSLKKLPKPIDDSVNLHTAMSKMALTPQWEKLRIKLHS